MPRDLHYFMNRIAERTDRSAKAQELLDEVEHYTNLDDWETQFVESISDQIGNEYAISAAQLERLQAIYDDKR